MGLVLVIANFALSLTTLGIVVSVVAEPRWWFANAYEEPQPVPGPRGQRGARGLPGDSGPRGPVGPVGITVPPATTDTDALWEEVWEIQARIDRLCAQELLTRPDEPDVVSWLTGC